MFWVVCLNVKQPLGVCSMPFVTDSLEEIHGLVEFRRDEEKVIHQPHQTPYEGRKTQ